MIAAVPRSAAAAAIHTHPNQQVAPNNRARCVPLDKLAPLSPERTRAYQHATPTMRANQSSAKVQRRNASMRHLGAHNGSASTCAANRSSILVVRESQNGSPQRAATATTTCAKQSVATSRESRFMPLCDRRPATSGPKALALAVRGNVRGISACTHARARTQCARHCGAEALRTIARIAQMVRAACCLQQP